VNTAVCKTVVHLNAATLAKDTQQPDCHELLPYLTEEMSKEATTGLMVELLTSATEDF
jgi:hypothetical protein